MVSTAEPLRCTSHQPLPLQDRSGGTHCYNCIIESFQTQAYNLARRMLNDWALAEDAVQESFVSGYRAFHQFRGDNLKAWLMRIVANACRDMLRARRVRPTVPLDPLPSDPEDPERVPSPVDLPSDEESPEDYAERQELNRAIQAGLGSLSEEQRLAILLVDVQGMGYEEASSVMNCSLGTVKSRLSRGRGGFRDFLRNAGELLPAPFRREV
jgi:RNA polymerase sigma-70 factor (ECF subfamily)